MTRKWSVPTFLLAIALQAHGASADTEATSVCHGLLDLGTPQFHGEVRLVCRRGYALGHSGKTKTPLWVVERLRAGDIFGDEIRENSFQEDAMIPSGERATLRDYSGSGCDRGHMAPAADFSRDAGLMEESFFLSNMVPQEPEHNRRIWMVLEKKVRQAAKKRGELLVITGPVFSNRPTEDARGPGQKIMGVAENIMKSIFPQPQRRQRDSTPCYERKTIGSGVAVPSAIYKVVYDPRRKDGVAFVIPNLPEAELSRLSGISDIRASGYSEAISAHTVSISELESVLGAKLLPMVPDSIKSKKSSFFK